MTDYSDLISRLRDYPAYTGDCLEAADVIEQLLARITKLQTPPNPSVISELNDVGLRKYLSRLKYATPVKHWRRVMSDYSELIKRLRSWDHCWPANGLERNVAEAADALEAKDAEIDFWKNRTREALETIKDNIARIAELRQLVARIVKHNDIDSVVPRV
jgi:hypothetical protein